MVFCTVLIIPQILAEFESLNSAEFWPPSSDNFGPGGFRISEPNQKHNCSSVKTSNTTVASVKTSNKITFKKLFYPGHSRFFELT
jgi:hypothetical protein